MNTSWMSSFEICCYYPPRSAEDTCVSVWAVVYRIKIRRLWETKYNAVLNVFLKHKRRYVFQLSNVDVNGRLLDVKYWIEIIIYTKYSWKRRNASTCFEHIHLEHNSPWRKCWYCYNRQIIAIYFKTITVIFHVLFPTLDSRAWKQRQLRSLVIVAHCLRKTNRIQIIGRKYTL